MCEKLPPLVKITSRSGFQYTRNGLSSHFHQFRDQLSGHPIENAESHGSIPYEGNQTPGKFSINAGSSRLGDFVHA